MLVSELPVSFKWHPGMAPAQKKRNVAALHAAAIAHGLNHLLEISSKSEDELGRRLSAFNLKLTIGRGKESYLECVYQASKVFESGGPFTDLLAATSREAKKDPRLHASGNLKHFEFDGVVYPLHPKNAFYDWLYIRALYPHRDWLEKKAIFQGYTDIEFNPLKSINCQARAFAGMMSLAKRKKLEEAASDFSFFSALLPPI